MDIDIKGYDKQPLSIIRKILSAGGTVTIDLPQLMQNQIWLVRHIFLVNQTTGGAGFNAYVRLLRPEISIYLEQEYNLDVGEPFTFNPYIWLYPGDIIRLTESATIANDIVVVGVYGIEFIKQK